VEVNVHHAKTNLSKLIVRAEAGEEVVIARAGKPVVRLVPVEAPSRKRYRPGGLQGRITIPHDFLQQATESDQQLEQLFYESPILSGVAQNKPRSKRRPRRA